MQERPELQPTVFVVDDDASLRAALKSLLRSVGLHVETRAALREGAMALDRQAAVLEVRAAQQILGLSRS